MQAVYILYFIFEYKNILIFTKNTVGRELFKVDRESSVHAYKMLFTVMSPMYLRRSVEEGGSPY